MVLVTHSGPETLPLGEPLPDFDGLRGINGKHYSLSDFSAYQGLVVIFTCNHCPYAVAYEDRLIALAEEFEPQGVGFVAISSNDALNYPEDSFENMQRRAAEKGFPYPYLYDESQEIAKAYKAVCTPHVFVGDKSRHLVYRGRIDDNWKNASQVQMSELQVALTAMIQGQAIEVPETHPMGCSIKWRWEL